MPLQKADFSFYGKDEDDNDDDLRSYSSRSSNTICSTPDPNDLSATAIEKRNLRLELHETEF